MARLDGWSDPEILAAVAALAASADGHCSPIGGNRAAQQAQLDAEIERRLVFVQAGRLAEIGSLPYITGTLAAGKLQGELQARYTRGDHGG